MAKIKDIREEELKNKLAVKWFSQFDCTQIVGNIDFCVSIKREAGQTADDRSLLWAEAKAAPTEILVMLTQLVLTIGKARTFDKHLPPAYIGCFDREKIAFVPYSDIQDIFYQNDFNWNVAPSDHETREFRQVYIQIKTAIETDILPWERYLFHFEADEKELHKFIRANFIADKTETNKIQIDKNNFINIYNKWLKTVKPTIALNWELAKANNIIDGDFYLADLLSDSDTTLIDSLHVVLQKNHYISNKHKDRIGMYVFHQIEFNDKQKAYNEFWTKYERPPRDDYWDYIIKRRDLLVPQDVRERKGSFFTPQIWVEKSQEYLTNVFGEDWQDEYYIWDCAAGTGNLLAGLTNKYKIFASTLDKQDVDIMHERIKNGACLLEDHVFQFDFLNDDFSKLPDNLSKVIADEERRKRLLIFINPPYAEADNRKGEGRSGVAESLIHDKYSDLMGYTKRELYIQFLTRIYKEISGCKIGEFSKLKALQAPRYIDFRNFFKAKLLRCFIVPADSFDNVTGQFPIGFKIWDTDIKADFKKIKADAFNNNGKYINKKMIWNYDNLKFINDWVKTFRNSKSDSIATIIGVGSDFQNQRLVRFGPPHMKVPADNHNWQVTVDNLIPSAIYFAVRKAIDASWMNDRDQFLFPNKGWEQDSDFQNDCLAYTIFNNNITSKNSVNHWIPFAESEVNARTEYESHFMISFLNGKIVANGYTNLFSQLEEIAKPFAWHQGQKLVFSPEATAVFDAGRELWRYYHTSISVAALPLSGNPRGAVNASLYDIREFFQGRNDKGKMNNSSNDERYNELLGRLRDALSTLTVKIRPKVYEYGFLKY